MQDSQTSLSTTSKEPAKDSLELTVSEYNNMLMEIREQPAWRRRADVEADYYDGKQADSETLSALREIGMELVIENIISPTIDAVLGLEAKTRLDWKVDAQSDAKYSDIAEALNQKLNEAEKETRADRANSDAFAAQIKTGLGWIEVGREVDPFLYPYRFNYVHRNEIFYDFRTKPDMTDARYLVRSKWYDNDVIKLAFADKKDLLDQTGTGWRSINEITTDGGVATGLAMSFSDEMTLAYDEQEWRDVYRKRMRLNEVWYRRWVKGYVLKTPDGRVVEFDKTNRMHMEAVALGHIEPIPAIFTKLRLSFWVGNHLMADMACPFKHNKMPYVPFWGKREDMTGVPYGMIRAMKPMQDEVNARNTKMVWLLSGKRVTMTEGATVDDEETVRREAGRPDALHILDAQAMSNGGVFKVESDFALNAQQYNALVDKRQAIKNVAGVYAAFEGNNKGNISGVAVNSLTEQSSQTLAEIYDNFSFGRTLAGELLLSLIIEDIGDKEQSVNIKKEYSEPKTVVLNQQVGNGEITNDVQTARLKVALSDVPSTTSYRAQRLQTLTTITQSLPPDLQALVIDFVMGATDLPERGEIVERIRKKMGYGTDRQPKNEQEALQMQQEKDAQAKAQQYQDQVAQLDLSERQAQVDKTIAETKKINDESMANGAAGNEKLVEVEMRFKERIAQIEDEFNKSKEQFDTRMAEITSRQETEIEKATINAETQTTIAEMERVENARLQSIEAELVQLKDAFIVIQKFLVSQSSDTDKPKVPAE